MFENLVDRLESSFKLLKGQGKITEVNVSETLKEIRKALLDADVSYKIAKTFCDQVKQKALGQDVLKAVKPEQMMVKIVHDELATLMGSESSDINIKGSPGVVLVSGLQGSGKTTFCGKLANNIKSKRGIRPLLVAGDVYRPAAIEQLKVLGEQIGVTVYTEEGVQDPVQIAKNAITLAKKEGYGVVIVDTAGRLAVDEFMMKEIASIKSAVQPSETLFVVDAMTGQDAVETAKAFNEVLDFDGVVLTKMDGDTRGGAALSIKEMTGIPIKIMSNGEKLDAMEIFYPDRLADRILGMGDIMSMIEKAESVIDQDEALKAEKKKKKGTFDLEDFLSQLKQIKKMGPLENLIKMLPGVPKELKNVKIDPKEMAHIEAIIQSMTKEERRNPSILKASRKIRIANGSARSVEEVNRLLNQFEQMKKMMKMMKNGNMKMPF